MFLLHLACLGVIVVGWSPVAVWTAVMLYLGAQWFAFTGFYHRYFSHKAFKIDRRWQFVLPYWPYWATHRRNGGRCGGRAIIVTTIDSWTRKKMFTLRPGTASGWSHMGWLTSRANFVTPYRYVKEWTRFPELVWLNRFDTVVPIILVAVLYGVGALLGRLAPGLGTSGAQMVIWGFFISTVVLFHATCTINSIDHMVGTRRFDTPDTSRNNALLALFTLGEGWHNNHHHYAVSARQGFRWWELDITYLLLKLLDRAGIVRDLRPLPPRLRTG